MAYVLVGFIFCFIVLMVFDRFVYKTEITKKSLYTNMFLASLASGTVYFVLSIVGG